MPREPCPDYPFRRCICVPKSHSRWQPAALSPCQVSELAPTKQRDLHGGEIIWADLIGIGVHDFRRPRSCSRLWIGPRNHPRETEHWRPWSRILLLEGRRLVPESAGLDDWTAHPCNLQLGSTVTSSMWSGLKPRSALWARKKTFRNSPAATNRTTERATCPPIKIRRATALCDRPPNALLRVHTQGFFHSHKCRRDPKQENRCHGSQRSTAQDSSVQAKIGT